MISSAKRAWIIVGIFFLCASAAALYVVHRRQLGSAIPSGPPPDILSVLPAGAPIIAYADVQTLRASPIARELESMAPAPEEDRDYREFVRATGFDYSRDLDRVAVAAWPDSNAAASAAARRSNARDLPRGFFAAVADGRFDRERITAYALRFGSVSKDSGADVYEVPSGKPGEKLSFTFLSRERIALEQGPVALVQGRALDWARRPSSAMVLDAASRERISHIAGAAFFAVARTDDLTKAIDAPGLQTGQLNHMLKSIRGITLAGRPEGQKLVVAAEADCDSMSSALQLSTFLDIMRLAGRAALSNSSTRAQLPPGDAEILDSVLRLAAVSHDDHFVRLRFDLTPDLWQAAPPASKNK